MKALSCTAIVAIAMALASAAQAHDYGTNRQEAARMTTLIYKTFGTGWHGRTMLCIARRESGLNPRAANYTDSNGGSYGLFQVNGIHRWHGEKLAAFRQRQWNPISNVAAAKRLARGGLGPWGGGC